MILDDIMKYRAQQLEREKAACGLDAMKVRAEKALADRKPVSLKAALKKDLRGKKSVSVQGTDLCGFPPGGNCQDL